MLKLLKYELKKRKSTLIVGAIALAVAEGLVLYFLNRQGDYVIFSIILMFLMAFGVILLAFLDVAVQYYNDFKKSQGTLLFLTPNSGYKIVGSKMIFGALELLVGLGIVVIFAWITNTVAINLGYSGVTRQIREFKEVMALVFGDTGMWFAVVGFFLLVFLQYTASQSVAVSSITLGRTMLSRNSYNWLWAVLIFIGVNIGIQTINSLILVGIGMGDGLFNSTYTITNASEAAEMVSQVTKYLIVGGVQYIFWIVTSFFVSSTLLNKKVDL